MKYYVDSKILESDKPLSLREIFDKLEFGTDVLGAEINGEIKDMRWIKKSEFSKYAFSKLNHKLFSLIFKSNV